MKRLCLLLCCCLLFSGCAHRQLEEELLVIVMAVDLTEAGSVRLTVKVPRNGASDGGNQDDPAERGQMGYLLLKATGATFFAAAALLSATTPRLLNYSQVREVVIGSRMAMDGRLGELMMQLDALPRFRCSAAVVVCRGEADAFAEAQKPYVGTRLSRYAETTLSNYAGKGFTPDTSLCEGMRDLGFGFRDPLFVLGAVNDFSEPDEAAVANALDALAGALPRRSADGIELFGAAATNGVAVSGTLTGYEMALVHLLDGSVHALTLEMDGAALLFSARAPAQLQVDLSSRPAVLRVRLSCEVRYPPGHAPHEDTLQDALIRDLTTLIRHLQALRCDGIGFADAAVRQCWTVQDWEKLGWRDVYAQAEVEVEVTIQCREG